MSWDKQSTRLRVPAKRYRIGELVRYSPFSRQTIHNYTIMGLIREAEWTEGGHRLYDETVFDRLSRIMELKERMSLNEIRRVLREEEKREDAARHNDAGARRLNNANANRHGTVGTKGEDRMTPEAT